MSPRHGADAKQNEQTDRIATPQQHRIAARERPASCGLTVAVNLSCRKNRCPRMYRRLPNLDARSTLAALWSGAWDPVRHGAWRPLHKLRHGPWWGRHYLVVLFLEPF